MRSANKWFAIEGMNVLIVFCGPRNVIICVVFCISLLAILAKHQDGYNMHPFMTRLNFPNDEREVGSLGPVGNINVCMHCSFDANFSVYGVYVMFLFPIFCTIIKRVKIIPCFGCLCGRQINNSLLQFYNGAVLNWSTEIAHKSFVTKHRDVLRQ